MPDLAHVGSHFRLSGDYVSAARYGGGHINDTWRAVYRTHAGLVCYLHQRINQVVFPRPAEVMQNIDRVTRHLRARLASEGVADLGRRCLTVIPSHDGDSVWFDDDGGAWRTYDFVEGASTHDVVGAPEMAFGAAAAFGRFQALLVDLPGERLHETIADFHHSPTRLARFERAVGDDAAGRASGCVAEIAGYRARRPLADVLLRLHERGEAPERVTHNDTKLNNVMIDDETGEALCVVDLETTMPGLSLYDFGDLVRTAGCRAAEDERDLDKVAVEPELYGALARGYLSTAGAILTDAERDHLLSSAKLITWETGLRFLGDHLAGDVYFKVHRPGHNLDRARTQLSLLASMERRAAELVAAARD